jgi:membrane-associated protease RseP (regulator of RpoE activity)
LFAGYLSLVFTAINLLPVGQLDGGHVVYGLFGALGHQRIAQVVFIAFVFYSGLGLVKPGMANEDLLIRMPLYAGFLFFTFRGLKFDTQNTIIVSLVVFLVQYLVVMFFPAATGYEGFLLFAFLLGRFVGVNHPGSAIEQPLSTGRKIIGWIALAILVLCFTPQPITTTLGQPQQNPPDVEVSVIAPTH